MAECISDHNDTNKRNNCLNLICTLNDWLSTHGINKQKSKLIGTKNADSERYRKVFLFLLSFTGCSQNEFICL